MRLLNTSRLDFEEFFNETVPQYAILSHRWEEEEVSYEDFLTGKKRDGAGFQKIQKCQALAKSRGHTWVWIDTCCIDKKSSAELSEAINSMYQYYRKAVECYVYLSDVPSPANDHDFRKSAWFCRGWTLQELLAPDRVLFFDRDWNYYGEKHELAETVAEITGINFGCLRGHRFISEKSIATRMSWVSHRQTTRTEDMAYCMLGIFDVNMPLLYGEGKKAFLRLQLEILKDSCDESIFAWTADYEIDGLLARWPTSFKNSVSFNSGASHPRWLSSEYSVTNLGFRINKPLYLSAHSNTLSSIGLSGDVYELALNSYDARHVVPRLLTIYVMCIREHWIRIYCNSLGKINYDRTAMYGGEFQALYFLHGTSLTAFRRLAVLDREFSDHFT